MTATSLEFVGTATTLLRLGPFTLLTDPNFLHRGQRAYLGKGLFSKRLTEPWLQPHELPAISAVLLSHLHGDHFDRVARRELAKDVPVVTTQAAARTLTRWGFSEASALGTWQSTELAHGAHRLRVTAVPGVHGPGLARYLMPPVMGSVLEYDDGVGRMHRTYISGDTLRRPWLRDIVERTGPLDAAVLHLGGTKVLGLLVTMDAEQGGDVVEMLTPGVTVPVHYDDYTVFRSSLEDFFRAWERRGLPGQLRTVKRGDRVSLASPRPSPTSGGGY